MKGEKTEWSDSSIDGQKNIHPATSVSSDKLKQIKWEKIVLAQLPIVFLLSTTSPQPHGIWSPENYPRKGREIQKW